MSEIVDGAVDCRFYALGMNAAAKMHPMPEWGNDVFYVYRCVRKRDAVLSWVKNLRPNEDSFNELMMKYGKGLLKVLLYLEKKYRFSCSSYPRFVDCGSGASK